MSRASIPFSITPDAKDYLRTTLNGLPPKAHIALIMTMSQTDGLSPSRWCYEGQSFMICYLETHEGKRQIDGKAGSVDYIDFELLGRRVAIESAALKQLSGQILGLRRVPSSRGVMKFNRYILGANSVLESPNPDLEAGVISEPTKRLFFIAALTVLGGFTGVGVMWILFCILICLVRIPFTALLPLTSTLFIAGWILGAIVSFVFFRSLFKASGTASFGQEQRQGKYLGYGGLDACVNWWVFLGIPIPLTGILIFFFEPFAHTNAEKSILGVGAIVVMLAMSMYVCDRMLQRWIFRLGVLGWALTLVLGFWYFKWRGP